MPIYEVEIEGQGIFEVESVGELTPDQAYAMALRGGVAPQASAIAGQPTAVQPDRGGITQRTGRRLTEYAQTMADIPANLANIFTGGETGGVTGRALAALKVAGGVFAPFGMVASPLEAAAEYGATGLGVPENWAGLVGDAAGLVGSIGVGSAAKAGLLGKYGDVASRAVGMGRVPYQNVNEALKHDPQLRFIAMRNIETEGMAKLRQEAQQAGTPFKEGNLNYWDIVKPNLAQQATDAGAPKLAFTALKKNELYESQWSEWAKQNRIVGEPPIESMIDYKGLALLQTPKGADAGLFGTLGTPFTQAARKNPLAAQGYGNLQIAEESMKRRISASYHDDLSKLSNVGDKDLRAAVLNYHTKSFEDISNLHATGKLNDNAFNAVTHINNKVEQMRKDAIPLLRQEAEPRITNQVRREWKAEGKTDFSEQDIATEVTERIKKRYPDNLTMDEILPEINPGYYKIYDKEGNLMGTAMNKAGVKDFIFDMARLGEDTGRVESRAYLDSSILPMFKRRFERVLGSFLNATKVSQPEIAAAIKGDFTTKTGHSIFNGLVESSRSKGKGYTQDVVDSLAMYDTQFERWRTKTELNKTIGRITNQLETDGYSRFAKDIKDTHRTLYGYRSPVGEYLDNTIRATPLLRDIVAPYALERIAGGSKAAMVNLMLKYNPRYQALNATQIWQTLWPIADGSEIAEAYKLYRGSAGKEILSRHVGGSDFGKVEEFRKSIGPIERHNQEVAFLTMYNRARKLGFADQDAADYATLRGRVYSQFLGLTTDKPTAFRKLDPYGMITMFQRFPIKQFEQLFDVVKDKNFPAAAKWLTTNLALGGFRAATLGQGGWLTYKAYKDIEGEYGKGMADLFHAGLPGLAGVDLSNSVMLFNPPMGEGIAEQLGSVLLGPMGSIASSAWGAALETAVPEPSAARRVFNTLIQRMPLFKEVDAARRLIEGDYDLKDPMGRLKYKMDAKDLVRRMLGAKTINESNLDSWVQAQLEITEKRSGVLDHVSATYGQAAVAGIDLGKPMKDMLLKEINDWNSQWPEFPISGDEILRRAAERARTSLLDLRTRMAQQTPLMVRQAPIFQAPSSGIIPAGGG